MNARRFGLGITAVLVVIVLTFTGCVSVNYTIGSCAGTVRGEGSMIIKEYPVTEFDAVDIRGYYNVVYTNATSDTVKVDIQENLVQYLHVEVKDGTLMISSEEDFQINSDKRPTLHISTPKLKSLTNYGAVSMTQCDTIVGESFWLDISGACEIDLAVEVESLTAIVSGAGELRLQGTATVANFTASGASSLSALELQTKDATIRTSGAGDSAISCSENLDITISGAGSLDYRGNPRVTQRISGAGSINNVK